MSRDVSDLELRWARAEAWARGQSLGPYGRGVDEAECARIEVLRDLIVEFDENGEEVSA